MNFPKVNTYQCSQSWAQETIYYCILRSPSYLLLEIILHAPTEDYYHDLQHHRRGFLIFQCCINYVWLLSFSLFVKWVHVVVLHFCLLWISHTVWLPTNGFFPLWVVINIRHSCTYLLLKNYMYFCWVYT